MSRKAGIFAHVCKAPLLPRCRLPAACSPCSSMFSGMGDVAATPAAAPGGPWGAGEAPQVLTKPGSAVGRPFHPSLLSFLAVRQVAECFSAFLPVCIPVFLPLRIPPFLPSHPPTSQLSICLSSQIPTFVPTYLPPFLPSYLPSCLPSCPSIFLPFLSSILLSFLPTPHRPTGVPGSEENA